nr:hypothetical protein [uncultured Rhodoferax sp.]
MNNFAFWVIEPALKGCCDTQGETLGILNDHCDGLMTPQTGLILRMWANMLVHLPMSRGKTGF